MSFSYHNMSSVSQLTPTTRSFEIGLQESAPCIYIDRGHRPYRRISGAKDRHRRVLRPRGADPRVFGVIGPQLLHELAELHFRGSRVCGQVAENEEVYILGSNFVSEFFFESWRNRRGLAL